MNRALVVSFAVLLALVTVASALLAQDAQKRRGFEIAITQPVNQEIVFGRSEIKADVKIADVDKVERVEFFVGEELVFVDREFPFECVFDFGEESRSWIVRAVAYHVEGVNVSDAVITRRLKFATIEQVNRVILWVSARDKEGNFITDLKKEDFRVYEDGVEQDVIDFYAETRSITMAILLDTSGSMKDKIKEVHKAAGAFAGTLRPVDQALVIDFDDNVFLIQDLTSDLDALEEAITSTEPLGATSLYDALHASYRKIGKIEGRKVVVLLSDGEDTSSRLSYKRVLEEAKSNNTMIFSIGLGGGYGGAPSKGVLTELSEVTGGRFFFVKKTEQLAETYQEIAEELGKQYYLSYSTTNEKWDGHWVKLKVESDRDNVEVRARRGYFAVRSSMLGGS